MNRTVSNIIVPCLVVLAVWGVARSDGQPESGPTPSQAVGTAPRTVGVLDLVRVFNECAQIKDLNDNMRRKNEELSKEAAQRREVIENKQMELSAFQPGSPDYQARRKDLVRLNIEANVWLQSEEQDLEQHKFDWTRIIYEKALKMAEEVAKERGYHVVLLRTQFKPFEIEQNVQTLRRVIQDRTVVYHLPEIDITDQVIRRLDVAYKAAGGKKQLTPGGVPAP